MNDRNLQRLTQLQLLLISLAVLVPVAWMVLSSFKPSAQVTAYPPKLIFKQLNELFKCDYLGKR